MTYMVDVPFGVHCAEITVLLALQQTLRLQGIYTGGLAHANELVQTGRAHARDFRLLAGYMQWHQGAVHAEVARGDWWLVAASKDYLLSLVRGRGRPFLYSDSHAPSLSPSCTDDKGRCGERHQDGRSTATCPGPQ